MADGLIIRPSSTPKWVDCARRSAAKSFPELLKSVGYVMREIPTHVGAVVGTAVHKGGEWLMRGLLDKGELPTLNEAAAAAEGALEFQIETIPIFYDQLTPQQAIAARQVRRMVQRYRVDVADTSKPVAVEERLRIMLPSGTMLSGQMDAICILPDALRDTKTGRMRSWNVPQYGCYSAIARGNGHEVEKILEDFIPRVPIDTDQPETQTLEIERRHAERVARFTIQEIERQYAAFLETKDIMAFPANPSSSLCKDIFCPLWGTTSCKEWRR